MEWLRMTDGKHINKPNAIIQAGQDLTATQQNILYSMLKRFSYLVGNEDYQQLADITYKIPVREVVTNFDSIKGGRAYDLVRSQVSGMVKQFLTRKQGKSTEYFNLVSYAKVVEGGSDIHVRFNIDVIPFLANMMSEGYTKLVFKEVFDLKGAYSKRIYELVSLNRTKPQVKKQGFFTISVEDFRFKLGVGEKKYPRWSDFKRRVIDPSMEEIMDKTNIRFDLEFPTVGRKIVELKFSNFIEVKPVVLPTGDLDPSGAEQIVMDFGSTVAVETEEVPVTNPLLDGLLVKDRVEMNAIHSPEYIAYYHKLAKAKEKRTKGEFDFASYFFTLLKNDSKNFYEVEAKKLDKKKKAAAEKAEREKLASSEQELQEMRFADARSAFENLSDDRQLFYAEQVVKNNQLYRRDPKIKNNPLNDMFVRNDAVSLFMKDL